MIEDTESKKIYSVSELTSGINRLLDSSFNNIWVEGEVSNFTLHSSGHCYFSLKDAESVIACVIFKQTASRLKFHPANGMVIICNGRIGVYNKRGQYQLYINTAEPKGIGALQIAFDQLKEKLFKQGLFDQARKKPLPILPKAIGVVTSPTGAAIRDILNIISRRYDNTHIIIYPAKVQGQGASEDIVRGIEAFNRLNTVDVIIIGRGGGSLEDLWAFNEENVALAIYNSHIPVVSAVGHEIDYTISDFAADLRAPTPSAAAELAVPLKQDLVFRIEDNVSMLKQSLTGIADIMEKRLDGLTNRYAFKQPYFLLEQCQQSLDEDLRALSKGIDFFLVQKTRILDTAKARLRALSPMAVLERGYSITMTAAGHCVIKDKKSVPKGTHIKTRLAKGEITSTVE
jgi:exodeoxyribonuclease VII large subunit